MAKIFDLSSLGLPEGTHRVQVRAKAKGYADSDLSYAVSYTVAPVMYRLMRAMGQKTFDLSTLGLAEGAHYVQVRARAKGFTDSELSESVIYVVEPIMAYRYVSLGDSISAGHTINSDWEKYYGVRSQYGENGNESTAIVTDSYTDLIRKDLEATHGRGQVGVTSFAHSGDTVSDLMEKLSHDTVREAISKADLVTVCIGANDILGSVSESRLNEYINTGSLSAIENEVEGNLNVLNTDSNANSYISLFRRLTEINPNAKCVFTTIYNPYKHMWIEEGRSGFFAPLLATIPDMSLFGLDVDGFIKDGLLGTPIVQQLFSRINGLDAWVEKYITRLNTILRNKIASYQSINPNFTIADTKAVFDPVPDRTISSPKHYNDLVNVEYTKGYNIETMDWGELYKDSGDAGTYWMNLATKYTSLSGIDINGLASELVADIVNKVIMPDLDPHPEAYGQYALKCSFVDALGWSALPRRTITFNANGGGGSMASQVVVALDNMTAYANISNNVFAIPATGYYHNGWADGNGTGYASGQLVGLNGDLALSAQWSNLYNILFKHSNKTNLYGDDETGHKECYALWINGEEQADFGKFSEGSQRIIQKPYGSRVGVVVSNYNPSEFTYDDCDCDVYFNGVNVASGYRGTAWEFDLTSDVIVDFQWKIAGSVLTLDMRSWEDCYITTQ